ncbi:DNRLRE domain-containing protein [Haloarcula salina]|uniref:DNRLRE domain-containing protein n=1 Tax=Haloarcula salina TaxID=1429914 RepID=A0AA41G1A6_9EURY|nr:DNRLRE domain-containing protein [Haloarcula salina]MBV0902567.1 DNRLRE domain-containing protein [Haloarcula salina]
MDSSADRTTGRTATRRDLLRAVGAGVGVATLGATPGASQQSSYWTVVALPDTQVYAKDDTPYANDQTQWIVDNRDSENIAFVSHEGDVVDHGDDDAEWQYMDAAMSKLDGVVPYSTVPGNHDWATLWDKESSIDKYKQYFGPSRYDGRDWYGGSGPTGVDENRANLNSYQLFSAGGYDFLHLALEWEPAGSTDDPSTPLGWGQQILDEHPDRATILTTHSYLRDNPDRRATELQEPNDIGNTGQAVWEELVAPNEQVFMVLCGHWHEEDGEVHQVATNDAGQAVYEMLANYQFRPNGGHGLMRRIKFEPGGGSDGADRIAVRTFSPSTDEEQTDGDSQFHFDLDFDARFGAESSTGEQVAFEQGAEGYDGTVDTMLREADPETGFGTATTLSIDQSDPQGSANGSQVLLRFDGVVGDGDAQVPRGATVESATLTLETADDGSGASVHRMLTDWGQDDTWASLDDGVQADDTEAVDSADAQTGTVATGTTRIDLAASVQAWADGAPNHGWVFLPSGGDGWDIRTAESDAPPTLQVRYTPPDESSGPVAGDADGDGDVDSDDVTRIQQSVAGEDVEIDREAADVDDDGDVDIGDAARVRNMSGGDS